MSKFEGNGNIIIAGKKFDIGTRVVLWDEAGGLNGYDTSKQTVSINNKVKVIQGKRYSKRNGNPTSLAEIKKLITQFFLHHSGLYRARDTFNVLHNERRLSCTFILDDDGTLYQTLDVVEKSWHGGVCNDFSIGIEIDSRAIADRFPNAYNEQNQKKHKVLPRKIRKDNVQGHLINGFEYNELQYKTLIRLGIVIAEVFPNIGNNLDFPRASGNIIKTVIPYPQKHKGLVCHYHASRTKVDPICLDYQRLLDGISKKNPNVSATFTETIQPVETDKPIVENIELDNWVSIQAALTELGYSLGSIDGIAGKKTIAALKAFQGDYTLVVDGLWGPKTKATMEQAITDFRSK